MRQAAEQRTTSDLRPLLLISVHRAIVSWGWRNCHDDEEEIQAGDDCIGVMIKTVDADERAEYIL